MKNGVRFLFALVLFICISDSQIELPRWKGTLPVMKAQVFSFIRDVVAGETDDQASRIVDGSRLFARGTLGLEAFPESSRIDYAIHLLNSVFGFKRHLPQGRDDGVRKDLEAYEDSREKSESFSGFANWLDELSAKSHQPFAFEEPRDHEIPQDVVSSVSTLIAADSFTEATAVVETSQEIVQPATEAENGSAPDEREHQVEDAQIAHSNSYEDSGTSVFMINADQEAHTDTSAHEPSSALDPDDFPSQSEYVAAVMAQDDMPGSSVHVTDGAMASEHSAALGLVPRSEATHIAVSDGSWFDSATWYEGRIPDVGAKVLIPEGLHVIYDAENDVSLLTVRVDGRLSFATDSDTFMEVDTLLVGQSGHLEIGTLGNPVANGVTAQIQIANNGPIDVNWDPLLLSRGIISHGKLEIQGSAKDSHVKLESDPMTGDTQLLLAEAPEGWNVGDKIILTGTHLDPWHWYDPGATEGFRTEDEQFTITAIDGMTIMLDHALVYDHDTPDPSLKASVANYTRNVVINTENHEQVPDSERGHVMSMHSDEVAIRYAEFLELGRTDKSERALDPEDVAEIASDTNLKGRYALHIHKAGVATDDDPAVVEGNAVWGSPGWGIVHHESHANLINNATYNTFGAGYVAESGNETGLWKDNIAIGAEGIPGQDKDVSDVGAFDLGRTGVGFWFQSRMIHAEDNIAVSANRGFVYFHRGSSVSITSEQVDQPEILRLLDEAEINKAPIQHALNNEAYAVNEGLVIVKAEPSQNHDVRSVFEGFAAWEVVNGIQAEYTAHYTFKNILLIGAEDNIWYDGKGFNFGNLTYDMVINGARIDGFHAGVSLQKGTDTWPDVIGNENYVLIDVDIANSKAEDIRNFDPDNDLILSSEDLQTGTLKLLVDPDDIPVWTYSDRHEDRYVEITGIKVDSVGEISYGVASDKIHVDHHVMYNYLKKNGYYVDENGNKVIILEEYIADRATGRLDKVGIPIKVDSSVPWFQQEGETKFLGSIDLSTPEPLAEADFAEVVGGRVTVIDVLSNDHQIDNMPLWVDGFTQPADGTVKLNSDGSLNFRSSDDFSGTVTFDYWVTAGQGNFSRGTVHVEVTEPPVSSYPLLPSIEDFY